MDFGTIFATIAMVVLIGISSYLFITGALFAVDTLTKSLKIANEMDNERLKTGIEIVEVVTEGNNDIYAKINNTGYTKILKSEFEHIRRVRLLRCRWSIKGLYLLNGYPTPRHHLQRMTTGVSRASRPIQ